MSPAPEDDDERTIAPGLAATPSPGMQLGHTLPVGTQIRDYEISGLIGEGGFGIVYLAEDHSLQRRVAIKEYMPSSIAARVNASARVAVKSPRHQQTFDAGLKSFVNEARLLARFDHPALVKVYRFWEENGTAYMVMPYYEGPTLKTVLSNRAAPPDEAALRAWLRPLLDALAVMHAAHCYHRDIAPDNILLTATGPLLLDFGAARRVIGDMTHALTVVLKPGYAPIEQYGDVAAMAQGAWTDLYALACVVYYAITGRVPMSSVERLMDDRLPPLGQIAAGLYSPGFLHAIDAALAVRPQDRPQTEAQFRALLDGDGAEPLGTSAAALTPWQSPVPNSDGGTVGKGDADQATVVPAPSGDTTRSATRVDAFTKPPEETPAAATEIRLQPAAGPTTAVQTTLPASPTPSIAASLPSSEAALPPLWPPPPPATPLPWRSKKARSSALEWRGKRSVYAAAGVVGLLVVVSLTVHFSADRMGNQPLDAEAAPPPPAPAASVPGAAGAAPLPTTTAVEAAPPVIDSTASTQVPSPLTPDTTPGAAGTAANDSTESAADTRAPDMAIAAPAAAPAHTTAPPTRARATSTDTAKPTAEATTLAPPAEARVRRERPSRVELPPEVPKVIPRPAARIQSRCSDILQKASLEPLTADEAETLKRDCR